MAGTDTDITARKRSEEALRQAEEINRRIVESTGDCVKILDLDGTAHLHQSRRSASARARGSLSELLNRPLGEIWRRRNSPGGGRGRRRGRRLGGAGRFQALLRTASGVAKWFDVVVTPITDVNGTVVQLLAVSRDITERRREEAFRAAQHQVLGMIAHRQRPGRRARPPGPPRRATVQRHAVLRAAARRRRDPRAAWRRAESSRRLRSRDRRVGHRSAQRLVRNGHVPGARRSS